MARGGGYEAVGNGGGGGEVGIGGDSFEEVEPGAGEGAGEWPGSAGAV